MTPQHCPVLQRSPFVHALLHEPQLLVVVTSVQVPEQSTRPPVHKQCDALHVLPPVHGVSQLPQWLLSELVLTQRMPHSESPPSHGLASAVAPSAAASVGADVSATPAP
jgi:hypothetical protein